MPPSTAATGPKDLSCSVNAWDALIIGWIIYVSMIEEQEKLLSGLKTASSYLVLLLEHTYKLLTNSIKTWCFITF